MSDAADLFREVLVPWRDKTLSVTLQNFITEGAFREHLEREALAGIRRKRDMYVDEHEYQEAVRAVSRDFTARTYAWSMPECLRCLNSVEHFKYFMWLVLTQKRPGGEDSPTKSLRLKDMDVVWKEVGPDLLAAWHKINEPDPQTPTGEAETLSAA